MEKERSYESGFSVIQVTAIFAVVLLLGSTLWQSQVKINDQKTNLAYKVQPISPAAPADDGSDELAQALADVTAPPPSEVGNAVMDQIINSYIAAKNAGTYTPEYAAALASTLAPMIQTKLAYQTFTEKDIVVNPDTSEKASLAYQNALHDALAPLRTNTAPEFEFLDQYLKTKDSSYLVQLQGVAKLYRDAVSNSATLYVPSDVVQYHVAILNSLGEFSAALDALAIHADDPVESVVLLRDYNTGEHDVLAAFNALRSYYTDKYANNHS